MSQTARFPFHLLFFAGLCLAAFSSPSFGHETAVQHHGNVVLQLPFSHQFQFAGYYAAQFKGYFATEGLDVELRAGTMERRPHSELIAGRAEYGVGSATYLLDRLNGAPFVLVSSVYQHSMLAIMVPRDSEIRAPEDLRGRRLAMSGTGRFPEVAAMFAAEGLEPDSFVRVDDVWEEHEIMTGRADAQIVFMTDLPYDMEQLGFPVRLMRASDYGVDFYGDSLLSTETELDQHPERVAAMRRAVLKGWEYALAHPEEVIAYIQKTFPDRPANVTPERMRYEAKQIARLINADLLELGHINPQRWRRTGEIFVQLGLAPNLDRLDGFIAPMAMPATVPEISRWVLLIGGGVVGIALLALLANWRLQRLVEKRTAELQVSQREQHELFDLAPAPIVVEDISELAAELEKLRGEGVTDLAQFLQQNPEQIQRLFRLKRVHAANKRALQLAGFANAEEMGSRLRELMTEQSFHGFVEELVAVWEGRENLTVEKLYVLQDGRRAHLLLNWSVRHIDGKPDYGRVRLVFTDITEIKRAEQALQESEERYRSLFETTPNPMYIFDASTLKIIAVNEAAVQRYGYSREEFGAMTVLDLRASDDASQRVMKESPHGEPARARTAHSAGLWRHRCKDGTILIVEVYTHTLMFNGRECVLSLPFDITAKLATERALRESEARYRELFENAVGGVYRSTPQGRFISVNPALARLYGFNDPNEMLAWNERERAGVPYAVADQHRRFAELIEPTGKLENFESQIIDRHGNVLWITETARAVRDDAGKLLYYEGFVMDITARRRLELEMQRASKLEAVGILAGGIAHDFNNILTVVLGNVTLAEMDSEPNTPVQRMLRDAKKATLRARDLTQQLLTFAKGGDPVRAAIALPELLRESADFALHGSKAKAEYEVTDDLWPANADKGQISQVLQNLVINAVQAMPQGGIVKIKASNEILAAGAKAPLAGGEYVKISVSDTGTGISAEHIGKIFDPYFTTKQHGSGLGLATVYSIVRKHQGHIEVESRVGAGTTFQIWLPAAGTQVPENPVESVVDASLRARVLFMDDEQAIREMALMFVERFGGECVAVADGAAAIRAYSEAQASGQAFDVVVMDLTVPGGMGGREAMAKLREIDPGIRAIVSSGYSRDPVLGSYRAHGFCGILPKPYGLEQLRKVLLEVLTTRQSATPF